MGDTASYEFVTIFAGKRMGLLQPPHLNIESGEAMGGICNANRQLGQRITDTACNPGEDGDDSCALACEGDGPGEVTTPPEDLVRGGTTGGVGGTIGGVWGPPKADPETVCRTGLFGDDGLCVGSSAANATAMAVESSAYPHASQDNQCFEFKSVHCGQDHWSVDTAGAAAPARGGFFNGNAFLGGRGGGGDNTVEDLLAGHSFSCNRISSLGPSLAHHKHDLGKSANMDSTDTFCFHCGAPRQSGQVLSVTRIVASTHSSQNVCPQHDDSNT